MRIDVDRAGAAVAWLDAGLPPPTFIVSRRSNGHAHLIWELQQWVRVGTRAERYLQRIRAAYTAACDGDTAYPGRFQHNPLASWAWDVRIGRHDPYSLGELAQGVDLFTPQKAYPRARVDAETVALGRNCSVFENVRTAVYAIVNDYRLRSDYEGFESSVRRRIETANLEFPTPLPTNEVRSLTRSITRWTWNVYRKGGKAAETRRKLAQTTRAEYESRATTRAAEICALKIQGLGATEIARRLNCSVRLVHLRLKTTVQSAPLSEFASSGTGDKLVILETSPPRLFSVRGPSLPYATHGGFGVIADAEYEANARSAERAGSVLLRKLGAHYSQGQEWGLVVAESPTLSAAAQGQGESGSSHLEVRGQSFSVAPVGGESSHLEVRGAPLNVAPARRPSHAEVRGPSLARQIFQQAIRHGRVRGAPSARPIDEGDNASAP